jgi:hypothetical protein
MPSRELALAALFSFAACANAQTVISTHSGVVHYFEGAVFLGGHPLENRLGKFANMADGSELRTEQGRAEVLLTPGVVLRLDQNSALRMLSNSLDDTRVELLAGSATIDAGEPVPGTSLTVLENKSEIRLSQAGLYRLDLSPARLSVREGEAQVTLSGAANPVSIERGMNLPLTEDALALGSAPATDEARDGLDNWSKGREDSVSADNQIAANIQDPANVDTTAGAGLYPAGVDPAMVAAGLIYPPQSGFTQFPMLGLSPISPLYSSLYPYQPGFYSIYLPGYTYRPTFLLVSPIAVRSPTLYSPYTATRIGSSIVTPRVGTTVGMPYSSGAYLSRPGYSAPTTVVRPVTPSMSRPAVATPRVGGRR